MKRYKLIKKLPFENSPEIGYISETKYPKSITHPRGSHYWCGNWFSPENYPEFWELVVEKDYEILSLIEDKFIYPCDKYGKDFINQLFNTLGVSIHSVKRKDGEVFTIGDKVSNIYDKDITIINKFGFNHDTININGNYARLSEINKSKQPLFKTEDGVDIFEGDKYYYINSNFSDPWEIIHTKADCPGIIDKNDLNYKRFSTKEKAEEYILMNKPLLTLKDVEELLCKNTSSYFLEKFKKRAQKLNNKN